jgi:hypothetical protein
MRLLSVSLLIAKKWQKKCLAGICKDRWDGGFFSFTDWYQIIFLCGQHRKIKIYTEPKHKIREMEDIRDWSHVNYSQLWHVAHT